MIDRREPLDQIKSRRDSALAALVGGVPYLAWLGIRFDRRGDELVHEPQALLAGRQRCGAGVVHGLALLEEPATGSDVWIRPRHRIALKLTRTQWRTRSTIVDKFPEIA